MAVEVISVRPPKHPHFITSGLLQALGGVEILTNVGDGGHYGVRRYVGRQKVS